MKASGSGRAAACAAAVLVGSAAAAGPVQLAPHRAIYDLGLVEAGGTAGLTSVSGRLVMEFAGSECAGYTSTLRFVTQTEDPAGDRQTTDSRSAIFESADGRNLEFTNETYADEMLAEESRGTASRNDRGIAVSLARPSQKKFGLSPTVVFPTEQIERVIASALKGERFLHLEVYDGSEDGETIYETAGVIGSVSTASDDVGDEFVVRDLGFAAMRHWPLTISYFDKSETGDGTPVYVMSFIMYENGVGRSLRIDYGDFALAGSLTGLELLPSAPCP